MNGVYVYIIDLYLYIYIGMYIHRLEMKAEAGYAKKLLDSPSKTVSFSAATEGQIMGPAYGIHSCGRRNTV